MKTFKIYYNTDKGKFHEAITNIVNDALKKIETEKKIKIELIRPENSIGETIMTSIYDFIEKADLVITNLGLADANVMYELGLAHAYKKPNIVLVDDEVTIPFDLFSFKYLTYNGKTNGTIIIDKLIELISDAIDKPESWIQQKKPILPNKDFKTVFVSYSHRDSIYLERLKIHMKALERKSTVQLWSDTLIQGGQKWKVEIEKALNRSAVAILLISADFLASDFIINSELQPLLKNAEEKGTTIIPIIIKPCRFLREASISQFQAINDPLNPLCKLLEHEQEEVYEKISHRIEIILESE